MLIPNFTVLILSKTGPDAEKYLENQKIFYTQFHPDLYKVPGLICPVKLKNQKYLNKVTRFDDIGSIDEIRFENGSIMQSYSAFGGRSATADRVIVDEAAYITKSTAKIDLNTVMMAVEPTIKQSNGQVILVTTGNGMNDAHDRYMAAKSGKSQYKALFFCCWDDPKYTEEHRKKDAESCMKKGQGEDYVNQEYPRNDMEAFLSSGNPRFNTKILSQYLERCLKPIYRGILLEDGALEPKESGEFAVIESRVQRAQYIIVADVADGLKDGDNSVAKVFDRMTKRQIAEWAGKIEPSEFGCILYDLGMTYNHAIIVVEKNNHGISTIDTLVKHSNYPKDLIFEHDTLKAEVIDDDFNNPDKRYGWKTTPVTRPLIINNLSAMISSQSIHGFLAEDIEELFRFVVINGKAQADSGCHDDRVIVLCIAYYLLTNDAFEMAYPFIQYTPSMKCFTCAHAPYEYGDKETTCELTGRNGLVDGDVCRLWELREFD
jgi:hypothetical protein